MIEAIACGMIACVYDLDVFRSIYKNGNRQVLFSRKGDIDQMAENVIRGLSMWPVNARVKTLSWDTVANKQFNIINGITK